MRRRNLAPLVLSALVACASPLDPAWVEVDLLRGAAALPETPEPPGAPMLRVVVDQTLSMSSGTRGGAATPAEAARAASGHLFESLPPGSDVTLYVLGIAQGRACTPAVRISAPERERAPQLLARTVSSLEPRSEGSLSETLRRVGDDLRQTGAPAAGRVVVLSDFRNECEADPCAALTELVGLGAQVDVVALGAEPPACLAELVPEGPPAAASLAAPAATPDFRVEAVLDAEAPSVVIAAGRVGDEPVALPSGQAVVVIELDPPFRIGPLDLAPGVVTTVRGADFPAGDPSWRAWSIEREKTTPPVASPNP